MPATLPWWAWLLAIPASLGLLVLGGAIFGAVRGLFDNR